MPKFLRKPTASRRPSVGPSASPKSQKVKLEVRTSVRDSLTVTEERIAQEGAGAVLNRLHTEYNDYEKRSHLFRRKLIASIYEVALTAKKNPDVWAELCRSPIFKDATRPPKAEKPEQALRYCFMAVFGMKESGRKKASKEARNLQPLFDKGRTVEAAHRQLASPIKSAKVNATKSRRLAGREAGQSSESDADVLDLGEIASTRGHSKTWAAGSAGRIEFTVPPAHGAQFILVVRPRNAPATKAATASAQATVNYLLKHVIKLET